MAKKKTGLNIVVNAKRKSLGIDEALKLKPQKLHSKGGAMNVRNTTRPDC